MNVLRMIWFVIVVFFNIFHIYYICSEYFKFEVTTIYGAVIPEYVELPALTLCFGLPGSFKWKNLTVEDNKKILLSNPYNKAEWDHIVVDQDRIRQFVGGIHYLSETLVTKKIKTVDLFGMTLSLQDIVSELEFLKKKVNKTWAIGLRQETAHNLPSFITVNTFFDFFSKCFAIAFHKDYTVFDYRSVSGKKRIKGIIEVLSLPYPAINHQLGSLELYFQYGYQKLNSIHKPIVIELSKLGKFYKLSFESHFSQILPPPYQTQCKDYGIDVSQGQCYDECLAHLAVQNFGKFPSTGYVTRMDNFDFITTEEEEGTIVNNISQKFKEFKNICHLTCLKKECKSTMLLPFISSSATIEQYSNSTYISIILSGSPHFRTVSRPAMSFIFFISTLFSTLGFWLGIAVKNIFPDALDAVKKMAILFFRRTNNQRLHNTRQTLSLLNNLRHS